MVVSIAWKNIWRNKSRSMVIIVAVTVGTVAGIFFSAWMQGLFSQKVHDSIHTEVGHLKLVNPDYLVDEDINFYINDFEKVANTLNAQKEIEAWSARTKVEAMATSSRANAGITLVGINPEQEKKISDLYTKIIEGTGSYFEKTSRYPTVVIGDKLAEQLRIKNFKITEENIELMLENGLTEKIAEKIKPLIGKRFITKKKFEGVLKKILTSTELTTYNFKIRRYAKYFGRSKITFAFTNSSGSIDYLTCRVSGVYKTSNTIFDVRNVFILNDVLIANTGLKANQFHEIAIVANDDLNADDIANVQALKTTLQQGIKDVEVLDIKQMSPEAYGFQAMSQPLMFAIMILIYFALAFGIINTMLMAIMERIKELGMLRAIGMKKKNIRKMIRYETIFLTIIGTIVGLIISGILIGISNKTGINLFGEAFEDFGFSAVVYPYITSDFLIMTIAIVLCVGILASIIPSRKALRTKAVEAMRID